jgi:hypothetical protein
MSLISFLSKQISSQYLVLIPSFFYSLGLRFKVAMIATTGRSNFTNLN